MVGIRFGDVICDTYRFELASGVWEAIYNHCANITFYLDKSELGPLARTLTVAARQRL